MTSKLLLASTFNVKISKSRDDNVLGLKKKGWYSWCSSLWKARICGEMYVLSLEHV